MRFKTYIDSKQKMVISLDETCFLGYLTNRGNNIRHLNNEDALIINYHPPDENLKMLAVCDGVSNCEYGKEASEYTCEKIKNAEVLELEYDEDSDKLDKYNRHLVWVFVDGELLQKKLVSKGYASVAYLYGDYKYTSELEEAEQDAEDNKLGIWSTEQTDVEDETDDASKGKKNYKEIIILIGMVVIICAASTKARKKVKKKVNKEITKQIKKRFKK